MSLITKSKDIKRNQTIALLLFISLLVLACTIMIEANNQFSTTNQIVMNRIYHESTNIAQYTTLTISGDDVALLNPGDEDTEVFQQLTEQLWNIQNLHPHVTFVYVFRLVDGEVTFVLDSEYGRNDFDEPLIGYIYRFPRQEIYNAFDGSVTHTKDFHSDEWGTYISSFVPLYSSDGEIVGIVGVDMSKDIIDPYIEALRFEFISTTVSVLLLILVAIGAGMYALVISNKQYSKVNDAYITLLDAAQAADEGIFEFHWSNNTFIFSQHILDILGKGHKNAQIHAFELYQQAIVDDQSSILAAIEKKKYNPKQNQFKYIWRFYVSEKIISLHLKGIVLCDPDTNEPIRVIGMGEDYTEFMRDKIALTQTTKSLRIFSLVLHNAIEKVTEQQIAIMNSVSSKEELSDDVRFFVNNILTSLNSIIALCVFSKTYADIGYDEPKWISLQNAINNFSNHPSYSKVHIENEIEDVEIYADMMFVNVLYNLFDNSMRHGEKVTSIKIKTIQDNDNLIISYEDDGVGLTENEKKTLFIRGVGKNSGLGMFLSREILSMTDIEIEEVGKEGVGAVFLLTVHSSYYRIKS